MYLMCILCVQGGAIHEQFAGKGGLDVSDVGMMLGVVVGEVNSPTAEDIAPTYMSHTIVYIVQQISMLHICDC